MLNYLIYLRVAMGKNKCNKLTYERFHLKTKSIKKIIPANSFTYGSFITLFEKYFNRKLRILDIGCGAGTLSLYLASNSHNVVGIDISENAIKACKESARLLRLDDRVAFVKKDFEKDKVNGSFDAVLLFEVIEHLVDDKLAIRKTQKLLSKGGLLILSTPSSNAPMKKLGLAKNFDARVGHLRRYTLEGIIKIVENEGFKIVEAKKTEGVLRNFLFLNPYAGKLVKFIRGPLVNIFTFFDNFSLKLFGESDLIIIARKL